MSKKLLVLLLFLAPKFLFAQIYQTELNRHAAWEVSQIERFVDRFDSRDTALTNHIPKPEPTREVLIKSLFNSERRDWNIGEIKEFIKQVNDDANPLLLNFYDGDWYASVSCAVTWNGKPQTATFKLMIIKGAKGGYKWVITDADMKFLYKKGSKGKGPAIIQPVLPKPESNESLPPNSHATDFLDIDKVSDKPSNISNYLAPSTHYSDNLCLFINECINNRLKIIGANSTVYHCSQVKGWNIEIRDYNRAIKNSGWLISKLIKLHS